MIWHLSWGGAFALLMYSNHHHQKQSLNLFLILLSVLRCLHCICLSDMYKLSLLCVTRHSFFFNCSSISDGKAGCDSNLLTPNKQSLCWKYLHQSFLCKLNCSFRVSKHFGDVSLVETPNATNAPVVSSKMASPLSI